MPRYTGPLPAYCRADGVIDRRVGVDGKEYGIGFALALPEKWNRDFLMQGGGGFNGSVQPPVGAQAAGDTPGLTRGFAVVSTDTGHEAAYVFDGSFMADQKAYLDYAYVAIVRVSELAKRMIASYYGQPAEHSYYVGCSTGGREGMLMTQRYPLYFDGVVSGDPAMRTGFSTLADRWAAASFNRIAPKGADGKPQPAFSEDDKKLILGALLKQCDAQDGVQDGLIFSQKGCNFDPAVLACSPAKKDSCLRPEQVAAMQRAFAGPKDSMGNQVYPGFPYDTGITTKAGFPGLLDSRPGMIPASTDTQPDVDKEAAAAGNPLVDTMYTNLSSFSGHGGKLLF